jgi:hypothetical protein
MWFTCVKDQPPYVCDGLWNGQPFEVEWQPMDYVLLRAKEPPKDLRAAFERVLGHRALAAYKDGQGQVVVEWRVQNPQARFEELQTSGVKELEKL